VEVYGHRHPGARSRTTGADTIDVGFSRTINVDKYDLRTRRGAHMFRERLLNEALITCSQLNIIYVSATPEENSACYARTAGHAMEDADAAIDRARGFAER
jgi:UrcA family protein